MQPCIVVDLGFGDAGKGLVVDAWVRRTGADLVVRCQGGAQAAHTVHTAGGATHTFAQLGAGSFVPGTATLLAPEMVVHPSALLVEAEVFVAAGGPPPEVLIHEGCALVTPYDQALNRLRELARGAARHGTCGVGVGEVVESELSGEPVPRAGMLRSRGALREALELRAARARKAAAALPHSAAMVEEARWLHNPAVGPAWVDRVVPLAAQVVSEAEAVERVQRAHGVVVEGSQGVLIDRDRGFPPHHSWTDASFDPGAHLLARWLPGARPLRLGVLRAFPTRHGPGPFPSEVPGLGFAEANRENPWQGPVRTGHFDAVLARYAAAAVGGIDALALTWLDALATTPFRLVHAYAEARSELRELPRAEGLHAQEELAERLSRVRPLRGPPTQDEQVVVQSIEAGTGLAVRWVSRGPTAATFAAWP